MKIPTNELNRFFVTCEFMSGSRPVFERGLNELGKVLQISERVWLLHAVGTAGSIRNNLLQHLGPRDKVVVIQFRAERTATQNCGPEADARLRAILYTETATPAVVTPISQAADARRALAG